jgi:CheY-like chemotaxis protein
MSRFTVLVVEQDPRATMSIAAALRERGWEAASASDATNALAVALKVRPDAVVVNDKVPGGGGMMALRRLRGSVNTALIPVIALGDSSEAARKQYLNAGAQHYFTLPIDPAKLCDAIKQQSSQPAPVVTHAPADVLGDSARLAALKATGLLDSKPEESFDRVTRLVSTLLGAPTALLSLVDSDRQFFKSLVGLPEPWASARETAHSHSFCQWVVSGRDKIAIDDAREHPVLKNNLAIRDLGVVAYAGVPVWSEDGQALGSLCAIDAKPRTWSAEQLTILQDLTKVIEGCAAQAMLARKAPTEARHFDRYIGAAGESITACINILKNGGPHLGPTERDILLDIIDQHGKSLVQLNRFMQVGGAIH